MNDNTSQALGFWAAITENNLGHATINALMDLYNRVVRLETAANPQEYPIDSTKWVDPDTGITYYSMTAREYAGVYKAMHSHEVKLREALKGMINLVDKIDQTCTCYDDTWSRATEYENAVTVLYNELREEKV